MNAPCERPHVLVNALSLVQGGGRTYVVNLLRELERDPRGFRFTILTAEGRLSVSEARSAELRTVRLPGGGSWRTTVSRVVYEELRLPAIASSYDLLYCVADLSPAFAGVPTVVALRNLNIYDRRFYDTLRLRTLERLVRLGMRRAERVIFPSEHAAKEIASRLKIPAERFAVVPHGISAEVFDSEGPRFRSKVPYLFSPCAPERHKNLSVAIRGLAALGRKDVELWIAGVSGIDPGHVHELERLAAECGVSDRVRFLGPVPYSEIPSYYRGAAALLFPSLLETFGHPLLEAMVMGTPVLATDLSVFHEVAGEAALYFQADDPEDLARRIENLLGDPQATARRVGLGLERARRFSWRRSVDRLCAVFEEVLAERTTIAAEGRRLSA